MKKVLFGKEAREKLRDGAEIIYKAVATTLSPKGRNVLLGRAWGDPIIVHDGVTVAKEIESPDEFINEGIKVIRNAAKKTNEEAGDGTTTSTVLAYHLIDKGMKLLDQGINPMVLRRQLENQIPIIRERLAKIATPVKSNTEVERVAYISSADDQLGKLVAEAIEHVGKDGLVSVEEGRSIATDVVYTDGLQIDSGYTVPYFITNGERLEATVKEPIIAVLGKKVTTAMEIMPLLEVMNKIKKDIVLIGEVGGEALNACVENKVRGVLNLLVVDVPGFAEHRTQSLHDIAIAVGAKVVTDELGLDKTDFSSQFDKDWLGSAGSVTATKKATVIVNGAGDPVVLETRVNEIRAQIKNSESIFDTEKLEERLAKLTTGIAVIKVGGKTEIDQRERLERVKDAVSAAKAALDEGVVPGGGVAFLRLRDELVNAGGDSINSGEQLLFDTLEEPIVKLLINAGKTEEEQKNILLEVKAKPTNFGYDVNSDNVVDLIGAGVIDPAKVIRLSLENAIAVAGSILTTDAIVVDERKESNEQIV